MMLVEFRLQGDSEWRELTEEDEQEHKEHN